MAELAVDGLSVALNGRAVVREASWPLAGSELGARTASADVSGSPAECD